MKIADTFKSWNKFLNPLALNKRINELEKQAVMLPNLLRPQSPQHIKDIAPPFQFGHEHLYMLGVASDTLSAIHRSLRQELFRNGYDLIEGKETDEETTISAEESEEKTDSNDRKMILEFLEHCNENGQDLLAVLDELEDDLSFWDDFYVLFARDYVFSGKKLKSHTLRELVRVHPISIDFVMDMYDRPAYDNDGKRVMFCLEHRDKPQHDQETCQDCGKELFPAFFKGTQGANQFYYTEGEILHKSKYRPSKRRGYSPILTCWQKVRTVLFQDSYIMQTYDGQRPPKAGLFFKTSNREALMKAWDDAKQRATESPQLPLIMGIPDSSNGTGFVEFIDFMKALDEMQYTEARKDMIRMVGAVYGVEPIFTADTSASGGLNNEGLQITVTNRAIEAGQKLYNRYLFPRIMKELGMPHMVLELQPSEEQDEMAKLERQAKSLENGKLALELGLEAEYDDDTGEVIIKAGKLERQNPFAMPGASPFGKEPEDNQAGDKASGTPDTAAVQKAGTAGYTKLYKALQEEIEKLTKLKKRKPTTGELQDMMARVSKQLKKELEESVKSHMTSTYLQEMAKVGKEIGVSIAFGKIDENAVALLLSQKTLSQALDGVSDAVTKGIHKVLLQAYSSPDGLNMDEITSEIGKAAEVAESRAATIARTETSKISAAARRNSYAKESDFTNALFKWIGPEDDRTTDTSKRIKKRTQKGVKWDELVNIVTEEAAKDYPDWRVEAQAPVSHYNSRHTFIRI